MHLDADAIWITTARESCARRAAQPLADVERCKARPLGSQSVDVRCLDPVIAKARWIAVTEIIAEDDHNVRQGGRSSHLGEAASPDHDSANERCSKVLHVLSVSVARYFASHASRTALS